MVATKKLEYFTAKYNEMIPIKKEVAQIVEDSPVKQGVVYVITHHTTTGIMVNENLECLEDDILTQLEDAFRRTGTIIMRDFWMTTAPWQGILPDISKRWFLATTVSCLLRAGNL